MAENPKIHPLQYDDVEAQRTSPAAPLVPRGVQKSDDYIRHGKLPAPAPPPNHQYPPFPRTFPVTHSKPPKKKRSCCCKCLCYTISILILLLVLIGIVIGILYLVFRPKIPEFSVDRLEVTQFSITGNDRLEATFNLTLTATNPNEKIGIYYEDGSHISAWYTVTKLCEGALPKFYQGHRNVTVLNVPLVGVTENATLLLNTLQEQMGNIPLDLQVIQPVSIKLGKLKMMKVKFSARCRLVVDTVAANNQITIKQSSCKFKIRL